MIIALVLVQAFSEEACLEDHCIADLNSPMLNLDHCMENDQECVEVARKDYKVKALEYLKESYPSDCPQDAVVPSYASDRFGSNFEKMITTYMYSRLTKKQFCSNPWVNSFEDGLEYFKWIGGHLYGTIVDSPTRENTHSHVVKSQVHGKMKQFQQEIRKFYFAIPKPHFERHFRFAIHIRRGDISKETTGFQKQYFERMKRIVKCLKNVKTKHPDMEVVHVFSQGPKKQFRALKSVKDVEFVFHLDEDLRETFHRMVLADVLILGRSTLSWSAGYLNNHGKIYSTYDYLWISNGIYASDLPNWSGFCAKPKKSKPKKKKKEKKLACNGRVMFQKREDGSGFEEICM